MSDEDIRKADEAKAKEKGLKLQLTAVIWAIGAIAYFMPIPVLKMLTAEQGFFLAAVLTGGVWLFDFK